MDSNSKLEAGRSTRTQGLTMGNIDTNDDDFKADDVLTLQGLVVSSGELSEDRKVELLRFLGDLRGFCPSEAAMRFALRVTKEEGVW